MLKLILGAAVVALIVRAIIRRSRRTAPKKPWPKRLADWLLARELAEPKETHRQPPQTASRRRPERPSSRPAPHTDGQETSYIRPVRRQAAEISLSYTTEADRRMRYIRVDHLPFRVGARSDCDGVVDQDTLSREHFEIFRDAYGEVSVRNLSRTNGIIPIDEQTGRLEEPIVTPGVVIPIDRTKGLLRFWAGEVFFTVSLDAGRYRTEFTSRK